MRQVTLFFCVLLLINSVVSSNRNVRLTLNDGKYDNLLIAIKNDVPEDLKLIDRIKDEFTKASPVLYQATKRKSSGYAFGSINILIPSSWSKQNTYKRPTWQTFESADIRIAPENPIHKNNPYTEQPGNCGQQASYIHFTPQYFKDEKMTIDLYGDYSKTIVHEWSHYRYGLFDEYPVDNFPHFYLKNGRLFPVRCSEKITGQARNFKTLDRCQVNRITNQPENDCRFFPDLDQTTETSSMMGFSYLNSILHFCDNTTDGVTKHNVDAPNKQNRMCNSKSAWEVLREHDDFQKRGPLEIDTKPLFQVFHQQEQRDIVLVLDYSGSMNGGEDGCADDVPIEKLRQAATRFILHDVEDSANLGVVTFDSTAQVTGPMIAMNSAENRKKKLGEFILKTPDGKTALGDGLIAGFKLLGGNPDEPHSYNRTSYIFLVSDGKESTDIKVTYTFQAAMAILALSGVKVDVLALGTITDPQLAKLSTETSGKLYFASCATYSADFMAAMSDSVATHAAPKDKPLIVASHNIEYKNEKIEKKVLIDAGLGKQTVFTLAFDKSLNLEMSAVSPTNESLIGLRINSNTIEISLPEEAQSGEWVITIKSKTSTKYMKPTNENLQLPFIVTSKPRIIDGKVDVVTTESYMDKVEIQNPSSHTRIKVFVKVARGEIPVLGARVKMIINRPIESGAVYIDMFDSGSGSDVTENDGIYSGYITTRQFNFDGEYSISTLVDGVQGEVKVPTSKARNGAPPKSWDRTDSGETIETTPIDGFQRSSLAGKFRLSDFNSTINDKDLIAPDVISNLQVKITGKNQVTLRWTAVGDDGDQGQANKYDVRASTNSSKLRLDFESSEQCCNKLTGALEMQLVNGSLTPKSAGSLEILSIKIIKGIPGAGSQLYFSIIAEDKAGNRGSPALPVAVTFEEPTFEETSGSISGGISAGAIAGICVAIVIIAILIFLMVVIIKKKNGGTRA